MRRTEALLGAVLLIGIPTACRTTPQTLPVRDAASITESKGSVAHELIPDPSPGELELGPNEEFVRPQLHHANRTPDYPPELVRHNLPPHKVAMRVTFGENGRALSVERSPLEPSIETGHHERFEHAVRAAMLTWRAYPPRIRKFRPGPDGDGDGKPDFQVLAAEKILKTFFDVAFTFEVVRGVPTVKRSEPRQ